MARSMMDCDATPRMVIKNASGKTGNLNVEGEADIVKESLVIEVLDANVTDLNIYYRGSGSYIFAAFEACFSGLDHRSVYGEKIKQLWQKYRGLVSSEKKSMAKLIQRNKNLLDITMLAIKDDVDCQHIYMTLQENLVKYKYQL